MQCERLLRLAKQWYLHVKEENMAPARMVQFIKQHVAACPLCQEDPDIQDEIEKITEIILPESKIPKAVRLKQEAEEAVVEEARQRANAMVEDATQRANAMLGDATRRSDSMLAEATSRAQAMEADTEQRRAQHVQVGVLRQRRVRG